MVSPIRHVLRADQFDRPFLDKLFQVTDTIRRFDKSKEGMRYLQSLLSHKRSMLYFTQPSTRTFLSFQSACHILGLKTSEIRDANTSSEKKGESIEDSLRTFSSYVDLIIMRSPVPGLCERMAQLLDSTDRPVPIINAGSGPDQHPTQALLDMYTLYRNFRKKGSFEEKTITMVGDLKRGRTVRSLSILLKNYPGTKIIFASPPEFAIAPDLKDCLQSSDAITFQETDDFNWAISQADAVYMTRIQDEYDASEGESSTVDHSKFNLTLETAKYLKKDSVIMHPMPRRDELDPRLDQDPRAKYWRQERNGMWTRVAIMTMIFGIDTDIMFPKL